MRGKGTVRRRAALAERITPAHAGKRPHFFRVNANAWDHPRPCGEKRRRPTRDSTMSGSPPPMRGKAACGLEIPSAVGITPAHAGKSARFAFWYLSYRDHPRPCGEKPTPRPRRFGAVGSPPPMRGKVSSYSHAAIRSGSPPPMRGKDGNAWVYDDASGITPAHAGKRNAG